VMRRVLDALFTFIRPPGAAQWLTRLAGRGTESPEGIARRLHTAREELREATTFEEHVVNQDLGEAVRHVLEIADGRAGRSACDSRVEELCRELDAGATAEIARIRGRGVADEIRKEET